MIFTVFPSVTTAPLHYLLNFGLFYTNEVQGLSAVSSAEMTEPIKMTVALWNQVGPRNHILDPHPIRGSLGPKPIEMPSGISTWTGTRKHVLYRVHIGAT